VISLEGIEAPAGLKCSGGECVSKLITVIGDVAEEFSYGPIGSLDQRG